MKRTSLRVLSVSLAVAAGFQAGCTGDFVNVLARHGGTSLVSPGSFDVVFINNTPYRAAFTFGSLNQTDQESQPDAQQFSHGGNGQTLDGGTSSDVLSVSCGQVFAIGSPRLLYLIEENLAYGIGVEEDAFVDGVAFYDMSADDEAEADACVPAAPAFEALLDVDFPCNSLVIIRFEYDDTGLTTYECNGETVPYEFRVDFEVVIPESA